MILLVSNSRDFAVDAVVHSLRAWNEPYVRLDIDLLANDLVALDPLEPRLCQHRADGETLEVVQPKSILYRAPTHLRESSGHRFSPTSLLQRHQWTAFARSLMVFRDALWVNHPANTFAAENKPLQLAIASDLGFSIPRTSIANHLPQALHRGQTIAVKALDSFFLREGDTDLFFYTTPMPSDELASSDLRKMPLILQDYFEPKTDVRITVIGDTCFVAETPDAVTGDWRRQSPPASFIPASAPEEILTRCCDLVRALKLEYGAIDLVQQDGSYHFLEINPTGEWAWLDDLFNGEISETIAAHLARRRSRVDC